MMERKASESEFETLLRESLQEGLKYQELFSEPEQAAEPMSPEWAEKEAALIKKAINDGYNHSE